ncbi:hypothetical protein NW752_007321 [Fusarium irregulare]|uniref:Uncharacterized protein n=1 Tax=Fusarium irregulare TaxID=2494466 RepID=A0A9W8PLY4_9HYPO|nr:hypothetical protein LB507_009908 [Fusarium sp. FIESC RH6]KAJ4011143.1 hypothetical protein NW766_007781 [Fusarium irregulare]KAJ4014556.1 hypothetical protein NW752_007321 [Fusarium irregulare]
MVRWSYAAIAALSLTGVSAKIYWDPVGNTCDPLAGKAGAPNLDDAVKKVWQEIEGMASNALQSMNDIDSGALTRDSDPWEYLRVVGTYDTFFDAQHPDGFPRWNSVKDILVLMAKASSRQNVYIMCDDAYMYATDPNTGDVHWQLPSDQSRILNQGPDQLQCSANKQGKDLIGYRSGWDGSDSDHMSYVVLCANYQLNNVYLDEFTIQSGKSLDDFKTLTTTLFHEFLHVWLPGMRADMSGGVAAGGERYGVQGTKEVRSLYANENPDSVTLFALALFSKNFYWMTTTAETKQEVWNRFQSDANGQGIINAMKLTQP